MIFKNSQVFRCAVLAIAMLFAACAFASSSEFVIYRFPSSGAAGCCPQGNLVGDSAGNLYGTAPGAGEFKGGTVFELVRPIPPSTAWTQIVLYSFAGGSDASSPNTGVIFDAAGNLYGTTTFGGVSGLGTVFELSPPATAGGAWTESVLYSFKGGSTDGWRPMAGLAFDSSGNLYGTTYYGGPGVKGCAVGAPGCGTIFQLTHPTTPGGAWSESVIYFFSSAFGLGAFPQTTPIFDARGSLYGATLSGGRYGGGVVYRLTPPATPGGMWGYKVLHAFSGQHLSAPDGWRPIGALTLRGRGVLYGTTSEGGSSQFGTVYQLVPPAVANGAWTENILYSFQGDQVTPEDGANPEANVTFDSAGNIYGTTTSGANFNGTVFKLSPPASTGGAWTETILHAFSSGKDGSAPSSGLVFGKNGFALFGVTVYGGNNFGTVFGVVK